MPTARGLSAMSPRTKTDDKSKRAEAIFFGLFVAGVIRIVWAYLKGGSLIDAVGITLTSLALVLFIYWSVFFKRFPKA